jgi:hypothetical protein
MPRSELESHLTTCQVVREIAITAEDMIGPTWATLPPLPIPSSSLSTWTPASLPLSAHNMTNNNNSNINNLNSPGRHSTGSSNGSHGHGSPAVQHHSHTHINNNTSSSSGGGSGSSTEFNRWQLSEAQRRGDQNGSWQIAARSRSTNGIGSLADFAEGFRPFDFSAPLMFSHGRNTSVAPTLQQPEVWLNVGPNNIASAATVTSVVPVSILSSSSSSPSNTNSSNGNGVSSMIGVVSTTSTTVTPSSTTSSSSSPSSSSTMFRSNGRGGSLARQAMVNSAQQQLVGGVGVTTRHAGQSRTLKGRPPIGATLYSSSSSSSVSQSPSSSPNETL